MYPSPHLVISISLPHVSSPLNLSITVAHSSVMPQLQQHECLCVILCSLFC